MDPRIWDVDGNEYIDYVSSWGPLIFGHAHPQIVEALKRQVELGTSYGASTELEIELAERVVYTCSFFRSGSYGQLRHRSCDECHSLGKRCDRAR